MKTKILTGLVLTTLLFASCSKDDDNNIGGGTDLNSKVAVLFTSMIGEATVSTRAAGNEWNANDEIGIFMYDTGTTTIAEGASNKHYKNSVAAGKKGVFKPILATDAIYYPVNGSAVDFKAYYPYAAALSGGNYTINVKTQTLQEAIDLMVSGLVSNKSKADAATAIPLQFEHKLSKLQMKVTNGDGIANLTGLIVKIVGMNTKNTYNLATSSLGASSTPTDIVPHKQGATNTYEAILLPETLPAGSKVEFTIGAETYIWKIQETISALIAGKKYEYDVKLQKKGVIVEGQITDWDVVDGGNISAE